MRCIFLLAMLVLCLSSWVMSKNFTLTLVKDDITSTGAVCLDGSPPGYYLSKGSGGGAKKYIIHMEGGGWCFDLENCYNRSKMDLGSSKGWQDTKEMFGVFSDDPSKNPDFYNWNGVFLKYCDGGSFAGDKGDSVAYNGSTLYFRGLRILKALFSHLTANEGLSEATDVILTGCSAGGLAVYLHADPVKSLLPATVTKYKAFADAGYFISIPNVNNSITFTDVFSNLKELHNISGYNKDCKMKYSGDDSWKCLLAPVTYAFIKTPFFVFNSQYDSNQLAHYQQPCFPPNCTKEGVELLNHFETVFNQQLEPVTSSPTPTNGYFLDSCYTHCQSGDDEGWTMRKIKGRSAALTIGDWYFERSQDTRLKDCQDFPCNPTCSSSSRARKRSKTVQ